MTVFCSGTVGAVERALDNRFARLRGTDGGEYTSAVTAPSVPADLAADIQGVLQLQPHLRPIRSQTTPPAPLPGEMVQPADVARLYGAAGLSLDGSGQTILVLGVYQVDPADIAAFWEACGLPVTPSRFTHLPGAVSGGVADEETMDIQWASAMAPGADVVYLPSVDPEVVAAWVLAQPSSRNLHQITTSYGIPEFQPVYVMSQYYLALTAVGATVFNATGDFGSATSMQRAFPFRFDATAAPAPSYPATDPYVTAVGGTAVDFDWADGRNEPVQEGAWSLPNNLPPSAWDGATASTGGYSSYVQRPGWQSVPGLAANGKRAVPDVAALSDSDKGQFVVFNGQVKSMGGTSLAAPIWSGLCALINQARAEASLPPVGLLGPKLYPLAGTSAFRPITHGSNHVADGFTANATNGAYTVGGSYNLLTGLGPPSLPALVAALAGGGAAPVITQAHADQSVVQGATATFNVTATGDGPLNYQWIVDGVAVADGPLVARNYPQVVTVPAYSGVVAGANTSTLTIANAFVSGSVAVEVVVSNTHGDAFGPKRQFTLSQQTFLWFPPAQVTFGVPLSSTVLNATPLVPGTIHFEPAVGAILEPGIHEVTATFTPEDSGSYPTSSLTRRLTVVRANPVITWSPPAPLAFGSPLSTAQLNASADVPGTFTYAPAVGAILGTGKHTLKVTFTPDDPSRYAAGEREQILTVLAPAAESWSITRQGGGAEGTVAAGQFEYRVPVATGSDHLVWLLGTPLSGALSWSVETEVTLEAVAAGAGHSIEMALVVMPTAEVLAPLETSNHVKIAMDSRPEYSPSSRGFRMTLAGNGPAERQEHLFPVAFGSGPAGRLRVSYSAADAHLVATYSSDGVVWRRLGAIHLGGGGFDWGMGATDTFSVLLMAGSGGPEGDVGPAIPPGAARFGNFAAPRWQPQANLVSRLSDKLAAFSEPFGVAAAPDGTLYVSDRLNRSVRKLTADGRVSTLAGGNPLQFGKRDGQGSEALFQYLGGIAWGPDGNLYVADPFNEQVRRVSPTGLVTTLAGTQNRGFTDGLGDAAKFAGPQAVSAGPSGTLYIADTGNNAIRRSTVAGEVTTLAGGGTAGLVDGSGLTARFNAPHGLAVDATGAVYVADTLNHCVRRIAPDGVVSTIAGSGVAGFADGIGPAAQFSQPMGLVLDAAGFLWVADAGNRRIRKISPAGEVTTMAGTGENGSAGGASTSATFGFPVGLALDGLGNLVVADAANHIIRLIATSGQTTTLAGAGSAGANDGPASVGTARVWSPTSLSFEADGSILVGNAGDGTLSRISESGQLVGRVGAGNLGTPRGILPSANGKVLVVDATGHAVKQVDANGSVTIVAGQGTAGFGDGAAGTAQFDGPQAIAALADGGLLVADAGNHRIRKLGANNLVSTVAGSGTPGFLDGSGENAGFNQPRSLAVDPSGNVFVADAGNHAIRRIDPLGVVTTWAGNGVAGLLDGQGSGARFDTPSFLGLALGGTLFVADTGTRQIRRITPLGAVETVLGLSFVPEGLALDARGTLHVVNAADNEIVTVVSQTASRIVWPLPATVAFGSDPSTTLATAEADVPGTFAYSFPQMDSGTGLVQVSVMFTPFNTEEYLPASATREVMITRAPQTLTFDPPAELGLGESPFLLSAQATSGLPVSFGVVSGFGYTIGAELFLTGPGEVQVRAWQDGGSTHEPVEKVVTILVRAATMSSQTINFMLPATQPFTTLPLALMATASSGLEVSFEVVSGPGRVNGSDLEFTGVGSVTVRAAQSGNAQFAPAPAVERTIEVFTSFAYWQLAVFSETDLQVPLTIAADSDPDGDGYVNLLEYALGLDPLQVSTLGLPEITQDAQDWVYTYRRPADRGDLTYVVEASTNLTEWSSTGVTHLRIEPGTTETWTARYPSASASGVFFRLKVQRN